MSRAALYVPAAVFLLVYGPAIGHGFVSDDFGWIATSRLHRPIDVVALFSTNHGFYRPVVALSFGMNYGLTGLVPFWFGLTNLVLSVVCGGLIYAVFRKLELGAGPSALGGLLWLLNFHGINMAMLWISGRTALLLIAAALAATLASVAKRPFIATALVAVALFSKEEAVLLPAVLLAWSVVLGDLRTAAGRRHMAILTIGCVLDLAVYTVLRHRAGAMTVATAPSYYQFSVDPMTIGRNLLEYLDRAATIAAGVALVAWLTLGSAQSRVRPRRTIVWLGVIWYIGGYAITTFLPVRSSLYACLPSIGPGLIASDYCAALWQQAAAPARRRALIAATLFPVLVMPVYVARNHRWTDLARYSQSVLDGLSPDLPRMPENSWIVILDRDRHDRVNVQSAFGTLITDAVRLRANRPLNVWVEPPLSTAETAGMHAPCPTCPTVRRVVTNGRVEPAE
jgi:hypothetical protein